MNWEGETARKECDCIGEEWQEESQMYLVDIFTPASSMKLS
jgi:hypothetical protein